MIYLLSVVKMLFSIQKVLIVQSMVNKETFVVKVRRHQIKKMIRIAL